MLSIVLLIRALSNQSYFHRKTINFLHSAFFMDHVKILYEYYKKGLVRFPRNICLFISFMWVTTCFPHYYGQDFLVIFKTSKNMFFFTCSTIHNSKGIRLPNKFHMSIFTRNSIIYGILGLCCNLKCTFPRWRGIQVDSHIGTV